MKNKKLLLVIEAAIRKEEEAYDFYLDLHGRVADRTAGEALLFVAGEEKKHKDFLVRYREGHYTPGGFPVNEVVDYKIAEHLEAPDIEKSMESKDVYLVAAHRELSAHEFYQALAEGQPEGEVRDMLLRMAREELRHKEKMEYLYANTAFPQTSGG
jgi:rubrerythrin